MRKCNVTQREWTPPGRWVNIGTLPAWYHGTFQHEDADGNMPLCLVEYEGGRLELVMPDCVQFVERPDHRMNLNELIWELVTEVRQIKERL